MHYLLLKLLHNLVWFCSSWQIHFCLRHIFTCAPCAAPVISLPWRDLLPLAVASSAPWRWHSSPARLLPWRWLQPGPVCRRRQRRSWRRGGWCSRSSRPRSKRPPPLRHPLPTGRRAHVSETLVTEAAMPNNTEETKKKTEWHRFEIFISQVGFKVTKEKTFNGYCELIKRPTAAIKDHLIFNQFIQDNCEWLDCWGQWYRAVTASVTAIIKI